MKPSTVTVKVRSPVGPVAGANYVRQLGPETRYTASMARHPSQRPTVGAHATERRGNSLPSEIPPEHAITRLYMLPAGSAAEFVAEIEDENEEPTPALRDLLRGAAR